LKEELERECQRRSAGNADASVGRRVDDWSPRERDGLRTVIGSRPQPFEPEVMPIVLRSFIRGDETAIE
jgi:hypothetical protein